MNRAAAATEPQPALRSEPRGVPGKFILLASFVFLGLFIPGATWACYLWVTAKAQPEQALIYRDRANWLVLPAKPAALIKSGFLTPPQDGVYNDYPLSIPPDALDDVRAAMTRALEPGFAVSTWPEQIDDETGWPLAWLKSIRLQDREAERANALRSAAFRTAPRAMRLRLITADQTPVTDLALGSLIVTLAHTTESGELDETVQIVIPDAVTDADGSVWLPIDATPVKLNTRPEPAGYTARWFADAYYDFPGQAGAWPDVVLTPDPASVRP